MRNLVTLLVLVLVISSLSSCATSGYGCRGKESWNKVVKRINNGSRP